MYPITQSFVLGAGLGIRLKPLTDDLPKPLVPIFQKPLITFALDHLIELGVSRFIINTHRLPEVFQNSFGENGYAGHSVTLVHEPVLLQTGGGIKNVERYLGSEPFVTYSGDILTDMDLQPLIDEHFRRGNDVTLALRQTRFAPGVAFRDHRVVDISSRYGVAGNYDFANIAIWNREIFQRIPPHRKISFIPIIGDWHHVKTPDWRLSIHKTAIVDPSAQLRGWTVVGRDCRVGAGAILEDTILWPGAEIAFKSYLQGCIVRSKKKASGIHRNIDI
ncbi:MAG: hypothetical protein DME69_02885 [Verrucomicrobia bacterium]|nr:MAG: hypothetical protein DME69_02885 [Verrucomicrobiota bacterium]